MPFRNPEDRRRYDRDRKRTLRAAGRAEASVLAAPTRLRLAQDVEALLSEAVRLVLADARARGVEKARALAYIGSIALRLIETHDLQERLEALEQVLRFRRPGS